MRRLAFLGLAACLAALLPVLTAIANANEPPVAEPTPASVEDRDRCRLPSHTAWSNGLGSTMRFEVADDGSIRGTYRTAVGCRAGVDQPLVGFCTGSAVSFLVHFQGCGSTTAWAGTIERDDSDALALDTLWHLVRGRDPGWDATVAGNTRFEAVE
ncbi:MAG: avidin/streptavidin family protein [Acidobacteriota bacterium]